jgi:hypothetical protein
MIRIKRYQSLVGSLTLLSVSTRPELSTVVSLLSSHLYHATSAHMDSARHVLRYLRGTPTHGISFNTQDNFQLASILAFTFQVLVHPLPSASLTPAGALKTPQCPLPRPLLFCNLWRSPARLAGISHSAPAAPSPGRPNGKPGPAAAFAKPIQRRLMKQPKSRGCHCSYPSLQRQHGLYRLGTNSVYETSPSIQHWGECGSCHGHTQSRRSLYQGAPGTGMFPTSRLSPLVSSLPGSMGGGGVLSHVGDSLCSRLCLSIHVIVR